MLLPNPARFISCGVFFGLSSGLLAAQFLTSHAHAEPFLSRDQNPLVAIYGLPLPTPAVLPEQSRLYTSLNISNTLNAETSADTALLVDGETSQLNLIYDTPLNARWALRLVLPLINHSPGYFDNWIDNYHQALNLPAGQRPVYPPNQLRISVSHQGNTLLDLQQREHDLGEVMLQTGYQLQHDKQQTHSLWFSLKLATGDSEKLTGSGHTDIAIWLASQKPTSHTTSVFAQLGGLHMSGSDVLTTLHNNSVWFGNVGLSYQWKDWLQLKTQLDAHSAFYETDLEFLGNALQLVFGGSAMINKNNFLDMAISEDIKTEAAPDVTLNINWIKRF